MAGVKQLIPLLNRVLVQKVVPPAKSVGGVLLPESSAASKVNKGKVIAVGPGKRDSEGKIIPVAVKTGDTVLLPEFGGNQMVLGEEGFALYRDDEILAVIEE